MMYDLYIFEKNKILKFVQEKLQIIEGAVGCLTLQVFYNNLSNNIQTYKDILQTPNVSLPILVKRKGEIKLLLLHTISIR